MVESADGATLGNEAVVDAYLTLVRDGLRRRPRGTGKNGR